MPPFLYQTAQYLYDTYRDTLSEVVVIMPNRRAGLFLRKYLAGMLTRISWAPVVFSIEDFIASLSGLKEAEQIHCLVELYEVHRAVEREKAQPFDEFLNWGTQLLSDFNELDRYLADPDALFTYLDEVRIMTVWNPDNEPLTEFQQNYLKFYHSLLTYYTGLKQRLLSKGQAYQGLIFRQGWERLQREEVDIPWKRLIFTGFNAMTTAEEKIIDWLVQRDDAELIWDMDSYYLDDPRQEAGSFLRKWIHKWPDSAERWKFDDFKQGSKAIEVIGAPDVIGQVKLCGEILQQLNAEEHLDERTAIVLPDERLLLPLLNSIPEGIHDLNITMGLSLSQTPLADLLEMVLQMHTNAVRMNRGKNASGKFYYRDVLKVLRHPYINRLASASLKGNQFAFQDLVEKIKSGSLVFVRKKDLVAENTGLFGANFEFLDLMFSPWESLPDAIKGLQSLVEGIVSALCQENSEEIADGGHDTSPVELEYAYATSRILHQLHQIVTGSKDYFTWDTLVKFLKQLFDTTSLPFFGEPLKGVQIMGMLETRTLDFDRVILLSCNEGILPSGRNVQSFIPYDVRRDFHLPLYSQKDAVYAYHFYRLLQRAKQVWLLYNTEPDQLGGGEVSRYVKQIQVELQQYNPDITIKEEFLSTPLAIGEGYPAITIGKNEKIYDTLMKKASRGFAPTALNAYRSCSLRFYFSEIAGLKEPEEVEDTIDPRTLGSAVHDALMNLYMPFKGKVLTQQNLKLMEPLVDEMIGNAFRKKFKGEGINSGKNLLLVEVARIMVRNFIRGEMRLVEKLTKNGETMTVVMLEQHLTKTIRISNQGTEMDVRIKGFVDRVDRIGGTTRVIDYKTGNVNKKDVEVPDWEELITNPQLDMGFQLLTYAYLLANERSKTAIKAGILSLKRQSQGLITVSIRDEESGNKMDFIDKQVVQKMEEVLRAILTDIYNPDLSFQQTPDVDLCVYCPYINLCGR